MKIFTAHVGDRPIIWELEFSIALFRRIKGLLGVDLLHPEKSISSEDLRPVVVALETDLELWVDVLYAACRKQAEAEQVSEIQFGEMLEDIPFGQARRAFREEWEDFFVRAGVTAQAAALRKQWELIGAMARKIDEIPLERFMAPIDQALQSLTAGPSATSSAG